MVISARKLGIKKAIVPVGNGPEAALVEDMSVFSFHSLGDLAGYLSGEENAAPISTHQCIKPLEANHDYSEVKGQQSAKRAMEIAAAGGHNLLMVGSPGSGKTIHSFEGLRQSLD